MSESLHHKKERLPALDGLRGLAALGVVLFHSAFQAKLLGNPLLQAVYNTFAVGPNSVQILFVLSGFLMAYLYPSVKTPLSFIQKRYTRIFPDLTTIVTYLFITLVILKELPWYKEVLLFFVIVITYHFLWKIIRKLNTFFPLGKIIFFGFILLQITILTLHFFIIPRITHNYSINLSDSFNNTVRLLSNLSLTAPFARGNLRLSGVLWSLTPEIIFYIFYPFLFNPLIQLGRRYGIVISVIIF